MAALTWAPDASKLAPPTVYAAELTGIDEALGQLLAYQPDLPSKVMTIYTDNQATIHALRDPGAPSGQYILQGIIIKVDCLRSMGWHLCLRWLPGHEGAEGNDEPLLPSLKGSLTRGLHQPHHWTHH
jgi:ribonuclease HI